MKPINEAQFPTRLQTAADLIARLRQLLDAVDTNGHGNFYPLSLAKEIMQSGKELDQITLAELRTMAEAAKARAEEESQFMRTIQPY